MGHHEGMPELIDPTPKLRTSFLAAMAEFHSDQEHSVPWFVANVDPAALTDDVAAFEAYVERVLSERREPASTRTGSVPMTTLWWVEGDQMLGRLAIRHRLTPKLEQVGGHIGYDVRPSARRRGHATAMLAAALPMAKALGIEQALLTCDETNIGSRRVIEANGGRRVDSFGDKRRYWLPTSATSAVSVASATSPTSATSATSTASITS